MTLFNFGFISFGLLDLLDIIAVTVVFYQVYRIMRGTRATQMFVGSLLLLLTGSLAQLIGMSGLTWLIQSVGAVWVIAFVIIFQPELRRVLIQVGQLGVLRKFFQGGGKRVVTEVAKAALELSRRRFGGLIVFQRTTGLRGVVETGISVQAEISAELIISIFFPRSPMHDGAVIIANETIIAASCILPLSTDHKQVESSLGTRHRAALSISEEVDAVVVVISEETGSVSVVMDGLFVGRNLDEEDLKTILTNLLYPGGSKHKVPTSTVSDTSTAVIDPGHGVVT